MSIKYVSMRYLTTTSSERQSNQQPHHTPKALNIECALWKIQYNAWNYFLVWICLFTWAPDCLAAPSIVSIHNSSYLLHFVFCFCYVFLCHVMKAHRIVSSRTTKGCCSDDGSRMWQPLILSAPARANANAVNSCHLLLAHVQHTSIRS